MEESVISFNFRQIGRIMSTCGESQQRVFFF
jgi:hypothetical protein